MLRTSSSREKMSDEENKWRLFRYSRQRLSIHSCGSECASKITALVHHDSTPFKVPLLVSLSAFLSLCLCVSVSLSLFGSSNRHRLEKRCRPATTQLAGRKRIISLSTSACLSARSLALRSDGDAAAPTINTAARRRSVHQLHVIALLQCCQHGTKFDVRYHLLNALFCSFS